MIFREDVGGRKRVTTDEGRVPRGLNSDQAVHISRLSSGKSFVGKILSQSRDFRIGVT